MRELSHCSNAFSTSSPEHGEKLLKIKLNKLKKFKFMSTYIE